MCLRACGQVRTSGCMPNHGRVQTRQMHVHAQKARSPGASSSMPTPPQKQHNKQSRVHWLHWLHKMYRTNGKDLTRRRSRATSFDTNPSAEAPWYWAVSSQASRCRSAYTQPPLFTSSQSQDRQRDVWKYLSSFQRIPLPLLCFVEMLHSNSKKVSSCMLRLASIRIISIFGRLTTVFKW